MKKITAIVRQEKLEVLKDALFAADVRGMTINQVQGCARTGAVGDGKIWVEPVEEVIRIRTGEHGPAAV